MSVIRYCHFRGFVVVIFHLLTCFYSMVVFLPEELKARTSLQCCASTYSRTRCYYSERKTYCSALALAVIFPVAR